MDIDAVAAPRLQQILTIVTSQSLAFGNHSLRSTEPAKRATSPLRGSCKSINVIPRLAKPP